MTKTVTLLSHLCATRPVNLAKKALIFKKSNGCFYFFLFFFFLLGSLHFTVNSAEAWPAESDWNALYYNGGDFVDDPQKDSATSRDIVGDTTNFPAGSMYNDGTYIYFRQRLDQDPRDNSLTALDPFGWGFLFDTDGDAGDYEFLLMLDGIKAPESIYLAANTTKTNISDPSDKAETKTWSQLLNSAPVSGNYRVLTPTDPDGPTSSFGGDGDYYLDYRMPFDIFKSTLGLTDDSLIRLFIGSSNSAQTLTADLGTSAGTPTLTDGLSDEVLPNGELPATATIAFVADIAGNGSDTEFYPGEPLFIRVDDSDQNSIPTLRETVSVTIVSNGDTVTVTLTETGVDSGVFTASLTTEEAPASSDEILQASPIEFVTASYVDAADADLDQFEVRSTNIKALPAADLALTKSVNISTPDEGDNVTFTLTLTNNGPSNATSIKVTDLLPPGLTYVSDTGTGSYYNPATGIWSINTLAANNNVSLDIVASVDPGTSLTSITNTAAITARSPAVDPDPSNNSATASVAVTGADIALTLSADTITPNGGDTVVFTLTATNNGSYDATGIVLTDLWNIAELTYVSSNPSAGSYSYTAGSGSGTWTLGPLANGASETLEITATVNATSNASINKTAAISSVDQSDPISTNDSASVPLYVDGTDLRLTKNVDNPTPDVGDTITYTLLLENLGANPAAGIQVEDQLPSGVTYSSHSAPAGTTYDPATGIWAFDNTPPPTELAGGASTSLTITAVVASGTAGQIISNTAEVIAGPVDADTSNDSDSINITVRYIDLDITKSVDNTTPQDGDTIVFTITVENKGSIDATNVVIFDELPGQLDYVSSSADIGSYSETTNLWTVGTITAAAPGNTATLTITCTVNISKNDPATFFNFASLQSADQEDPVNDNNTDSVLIGVAGTDISVVKSVDQNNPSTGDRITYTLVVTNNGPNTATNLEISEVLPAGLSYVSSSSDYGSQTSYNDGTGIWVIGNKSGGDTVLPAYTTVTLTVTADVTAANGTTLVNTALVSSLDEAETDSTNNTSQVTVIVGGADLALGMVADTPTPTVGDTVTYTLTLTNNGPDSANLIEVKDLLPTGLTYSNHNPEPGTTYDQATGIWDVGTLASGTTIALELVATVDAGTGGTTLTKTATVTNSSLPDPNTANDTASVILVVQEADMALSKIVDNATPQEGDTVVFTITVLNNGPTSANGLEVTDLLPTGLTYSSHTPEPGTTYDETTGIWDLSGLTLAKQTSAALTITADIDFSTAGTDITNTAEITAAGTYDPVLGNNLEDAILTPVAAPVANLTILKSASSASAQPGDTITYTIIITNTGAGPANNVILDDVMMSNFVALGVNPYGNGTPFTYIDPSPFSDSGLTVGTISYEDQSGTPITLTDGGGGAPAGSDGRVAKWTVTYNGSLPAAESFTVIYQTVIK